MLPNLLLRFSAPEAWLDAFSPQVVLLGAVRVAVVLALAALVLALVRRGTDRWMKSVAELPATDPGRQRAITLGNLLQSMAGYVVWAIAGIMVLSGVGLSYDQDVDAILSVVERVADEWMAEHEDIVLEESPQIQSLMDFGDSSVTARVVVRVKPGEQYAAERELRQQLKRAFDEKGVEIPLPRRTTHVVQGEALPPAPESDDAVDSPSFSKLAESR